MTPRNNPGNLRFSFTIRWLGQLGQMDGFCVFDTLDDGARALCIDLLNAQRIHRLQTIEEIIPHYAPPSENDTKAYILAVATEMGVAIDDVIDLRVAATLQAFAGAVWHHEQGQAPDMPSLAYGVAQALAQA